ncbi:hypothetical protein [Methylocella sp.]|uniref:hypothetical protein n=1 Tax=Methylocella sp. TaxID=1978226 RepID=UPI003782F173
MKQFAIAAGVAALFAGSAAAALAQVRTVGPARPILATGPLVNVPPLLQAQPIEYRSAAPAAADPAPAAAPGGAPPEARQAP